MTIYYALLAWIAVLALLVRHKSLRVRNAVIVAGGSAAIILLQALRDFSVGVDLVGYIPAYEAVKHIILGFGEKLFNYEIGYLYFSQLFSTIGVDPHVYLGIVAAVIIVPIGLTIRRYSSSAWTSMLLYVTLGLFVFTFSGLRQSIALAICFFSFRFIQEKRPVIFCLLVALAVTFHMSAVVFALAYPLYHFKLTNIWRALTVPILAVVFLLRASIFAVMYGLYRGFAGTPETTDAYGLLIAMMIVYALVYAFGDRRDYATQGYNNLFLAAIVVQMFASQSNVVMRAGYYYFIFIILLIPGVISAQKDRYVRLFVLYVLCCASLLFFQWKAGSGYLNVSPYKFFWN